jgi:hypothetical protein
MMSWIHPKESALVDRALLELQKRRKPASADNMVAELTFGFWCSMFDRRYEPAYAKEPWPGLLKPVLPRAPRWARNRSRILDRLEKARFIRNRVFHHEPIAHLPDMVTRYTELNELLGWFSPDASAHLRHVCRFQSVWDDVLVLSDPARHTTPKA